MNSASAVIESHSPQRVERRRTSPFRVEVVMHYSNIADRWQALSAEGAGLAFQGKTWVSSWYATLGRAADAVPLAVTIVDSRTKRDVMALPLVRRVRNGLRVIEFADGGLTDYNAPILGPDAPRTAQEAERIWETLRNNLPAADILRFEKMPLNVGDVPNPLALVAAARPSRLSGNLLCINGAWDDWHWGLERTFRKELERSGRVFEKYEGATFRRIRDMNEARRVFAELKRMQSERIRAQGLPYALDEPANDTFYDTLLANGLENGDVALTTLTVGDRVVAALLGIAKGDHYAMVRLAADSENWKTCSPGRLVIERTMKLLHAEGFRNFDFTIGDYDYKRRLGATSQPLCEIETALSWRGAPRVAFARAKQVARANPRLAQVIRKLRGA